MTLPKTGRTHLDFNCSTEFGLLFWQRQSGWEYWSLLISFATLPQQKPTSVYLSIQIIHSCHSQDGHDVLHRPCYFYSTCTLLLCWLSYFALQLHWRLHERGIVYILHGSMALWTHGKTISPCDLIPFLVMHNLRLSLANSQNLTFCAQILHLTMAHGMSNILYPIFNQPGTWHPVSQMLYATCLQFYPHTSLC